jgi:hypothetical protein
MCFFPKNGDFEVCCLSRKHITSQHMLNRIAKNSGKYAHSIGPPEEKRTQTCFQESGDGQGGDRTVRVRDQVLQVQVARRHRRRMRHGHLGPML